MATTAALFLTVLALVGAQVQAFEDPASMIVQKALHKRCTHSYTASCLKMDLVSFVDRIGEQDSYQLLPSVSMVRQDGADSEGRSAGSDSMDSVMEAVAQDAEVAEGRLDGLLMDRMSRYLDTHAISVRLFDDATLAKIRKAGQDAAEKYSFLAVQSGRGKDKKGGGALLMGLMMMKATLGALGFGAIAALAGKALMIGMLAMMLSAIVGLKSLASGGGKSVTYEIVSKPVYSHSQSHSSEHEHGHGYGGGSSYGHRRSLDAAHEMAYAGQR
ncbi:uncharacterized protein LOC132192726 [Neocloeon triangulifer]|uniref:uncharacterized protein LOC132192726 n=1 Tax=Neocloeon triangulifer TaxID=2078957 RepID=UPI00286F5D5B|nr:uncharacterized protein LOC132192726 [Neocloeon triangulifer]